MSPMSSSSIYSFPDETSLQTKTRPYFNHSVEFKEKYTAAQRTQMLEKVGWNVFFFPSNMVTGCDLLSDSGTTTMTNRQWSALHLGDEAYGSNRGYFLLLAQIGETFGKDYYYHPSQKIPTVFIFHQGRACEHALFSLLAKIKPNQIIPSNGHFDTTHANLTANKIKALNFFSKELSTDDSEAPFKGNMDINRLKDFLSKNSDSVPLIFMTITNNTGGGQPVSMENIKTVSSIAKSYKIPFFFDACRFAENAFFIKKREKQYNSKSIGSIVHEMFSYVDGFTISFKKDGLVNMGGGLILRSDGQFIKSYPHFPEALTNHQITTEGHPTYGGLSGRDLMTLVDGLQIIIKEEYLNHRIEQIKILGQKMTDFNLPVLTPFGGHAVYLDMNRFFQTSAKRHKYGGIAFTALLLARFGHRACELGNFAFGEYNKKTGKEKKPEVNYVRFAVPRLRYETQDLLNVAESAKELYLKRDTIPVAKTVYGIDLPLRHFKARFSFRYS